MQEKKTMRKNLGFTALELMVVIGLIAILMSIAVPSLIGWLPDYRLRSGTEDIQSALQLARLRAINGNTTATVSFDLGNESYQASVGGQTFKAGQMPTGVNIFSADFAGAQQVQFNSKGFSNLAGGTVEVRNSQGGTRQITVSFTGNSRVE
jgi:prepilin-type N-terminal cleavage/methylation domain-containing protein